MSEFLQKLGSYQIMTNLLPGAFLAGMLRMLFKIELPSTGIFEIIIACYFWGLIVNRIGSLIIEPILTRPIGKNKFKLIDRALYSEYLSASQADTKLDALSETNNCYRSFMTASLILPIVYGLSWLYSNCLWFNEYWRWFAVLFLVMLFFFSIKKQTAYVRDRVNQTYRREK